MENIVSTIAPPTSKPAGITETLWFNALWFQSTWFCTVLGRDEWLPLAFAMIALHLALVRDVWRELLILSTIASIGIAVDASLSYGDFFQFSNGALVPLWLCCLWLAFATTMTRSLAWLGPHPLWAALAGAVVIPLNYWAGQRLGAVDFPQPLALTLVVMGTTWALLLPVMYRLAARLKEAEPELATA
jgi:hypothetical protein